MFEAELSFFVAHQEELVAQHRGKVLVLRDREVAGVYDDPLTAFLAATKQFAPGTFMLQPCEPGPAAYTVTIAPIFSASFA